MKTNKELHFRFLALLLLVPLAGMALMIDLPVEWGSFIGDSAVYYAMADSLAHDHDLLFTKKDLLRIEKEWPGGPQGVLLSADENNPDIIHYAKPILFPLLSSPLVFVLKSNGMLLFNVFCMMIILLVGFSAFPEDSDRPVDRILWTLVFWMLTVVPAYMFSLTPDLFNAACVMLGLWPWLLWERNAEKRLFFPGLSIFILGIAAVARPPNALFILIPLWAFISTLFSDIKTGRYGKAFQCVRSIIILMFVFLAGAVLMFWITHILTGQFLAHGGFRKRITGHFPFEAPGITFLNTGNEISTRSTKFVFHWSTLLLNIKYFFIGRFTGLVCYFFPAAASMLLALPLFSGKKRGFHGSGRFSAWVVCLGMIFFHLVYIPTNYHGGSCSIGNRYLISYLPAFFFLLRRLPRRRTILAIALMTAVLTGPIAVNPFDSMKHYRDVSKRSTFDRFPLEITLLNSWPVDDDRHVRIPYNGYYAYFADDNQWGKELDGVWIKGKSTASFVLRCWKPVRNFQVKLKNGGCVNTIKGTLGQAAFLKSAAPGEHFVLNLSPGPPKLFYNLSGNPSYCYPVRITTTNGFIPKFSEPGNQDTRYLGCFIQISISP